MADDTLPHGGRSREEIANIEVGQTTVSAPVARFLVAFFLAAIALVPLTETVAHRASSDGAPSIWSRLLRTFPRMAIAHTQAVRENSSAWHRMLAANRELLAGLSDFESALEDESVLGRRLRPPAQAVLSGWLGAGTERVYVGRTDENGTRWLFYRPDLEYLTNRGFLDDDVLRRRRSAVSEWTDLPEPDPRPAILGFHRQLAALGITLVVMPTPVKPGIHPEKIVASYPENRGPAENPSYAQFLEWLGREGIAVFDPADALADARRSSAQYLATDTHWRPEAMELAAERLAAFITERTPLPAAGATGYRIDEREISNQGDTLAMLDLSQRQRLFPQERVVISRVVSGDGRPWRSDRGADVLVLGDSFANIYSLSSMGWGDAAGFVEQLSYALARPVDRIVQNDDGAFATREMLLKAGPERLAGKRVVVWQFAARELAAGNWKVIE